MVFNTRLSDIFGKNVAKLQPVGHQSFPEGLATYHCPAVGETIQESAVQLRRIAGNEIEISLNVDESCCLQSSGGAGGAGGGVGGNEY